MKSLCLLLSLICSLSFAGTIDPNLEDKSYIDYGSNFKCVVYVFGESNDDSPYCASGVAIQPNWVLTAAHVIKEAKVCNIKTEKKTINASMIIPHKDFVLESLSHNDIALLYCQNNLELDFYPELYENNDELGQVCSLSGYGISGTFDTGATVVDNNRRAGFNKINILYGDLLVCTLRDKNTPMEFFISSGDSGGGLFIDKKLAGINSCILKEINRKDDSVYRHESGHTRISKQLTWIKETISKNEKK